MILVIPKSLSHKDPKVSQNHPISNSSPFPLSQKVGENKKFKSVIPPDLPQHSPLCLPLSKVYLFLPIPVPVPTKAGAPPVQPFFSGEAGSSKTVLIQSERSESSAWPHVSSCILQFKPILILNKDLKNKDDLKKLNFLLSAIIGIKS